MPHPNDGNLIGPTVSVIIPAYNCERYITDTITSVLDQTYQDFELIVVDDGSTDRTREVISSFGPPVRLLTQPNAGVCRSRNRGIRESRGQYLCLMDHDDYWFPDKLEHQVRIMDAHPDCGVSYSSFIRWYADSQGCFPPPAQFHPEIDPEAVDEEYSGWIYHHFLTDCWMLTSTAMFRRCVFKTCGVFDEALPYSEDWDLWLRISRECSFLKLERPTTLYRQHPAQGNRVVRGVDYRTLLLAKAVKKWGLCSRDGRCLAPGRFRRQLATYHADYAFHHVAAGNRGTAISSLWKAWACHPLKIRYLVYIFGALFGWRPDW